MDIVPRRKDRVSGMVRIGEFRAKTQSQLSPNPPARNLPRSRITAMDLRHRKQGGKRG